MLRTKLMYAKSNEISKSRLIVLLLFNRLEIWQHGEGVKYQNDTFILTADLMASVLQGFTIRQLTVK